MPLNVADFLGLLGDALLLYVFLAGASATFWLGARWLVPDRSSNSTIAIVAPICGPLLLSWVFVYATALVPGLSRAVLLGASAVALLPGLVAVTAQADRRVMRSLKGLVPGGRGYAVAVNGVILIGLGAILVLLALFPLYGNDPLEYVQVARLMAEARSGGGYPFLDGAATGGFISPWTHPPAFPGLLAFAMLVQNSTEAVGAGKFIAPWFVVATLVANARLAGSRWRSAGLLAAAFLLGTPDYFDLAVQCHIDVPRIAALLAAILAIKLAIERPTMRAALLAGVASGLSQFTHSIGFVTLPLVLVLFTFASLARGTPAGAILRTILIIVPVSLAFIAPQIARNLAIYGRVLQDNVPVWDLPFIRINEYLAATRMLNTWTDKVVFGALAPLFSLTAFGLAGLVALAGLCTRVWVGVAHLRERGWAGLYTRLGGDTYVLPAMVVCGFVGLALLSALAGSYLIIKNPRYLVTVQPFMALLAGLFLTDLYHAALRRRMDARARSPSEQGGPGGSLAFYGSGHGVGLVGYANAKLQSTPFWVSTLIGFLMVPGLVWFTLVFARDTIKHYDLSPRLIFDSELAKRTVMRRPSARLENVMRETISPNEMTLTFRQSDFGAYVGRNLMSHLDRRLMPVYLTHDAGTAHRKLKELGISWIHQPAYGLPEIYNSVFTDLLASPRLVELVADELGWRLYRLRDVPAAANLRVVVAEDLADPAVDQRKWFVLGPRGRSALERTAGDPLEIKSAPVWISRSLGYRTLTDQEWPGAETDLAPVTGTSEFPVEGGLYRFEAEVSGEGLMGIGVRTEGMASLGHMANGQPVWEGVLGGGRRRIAALFRLEPRALRAEQRPLDVSTGGGTGIPAPRRTAQIVFRIHETASVAIEGWKIEKVDETAGDVGAHMAGPARVRGWQGAGPVQLRALPARPPAPDEVGVAVAVKKTTSDLGRLSSPPLYPVLSRSDGSATQEPGLSEVPDRIALTIAMDVRGSTRAGVTAEMLCDTQHGPRSPGASSERYDGTAVPIGEIEAQSKLTRHTIVLNPPCVPRAVRLNYGLSGYVSRANAYGRSDILEVHNLDVGVAIAGRDGHETVLAYRPLHSVPLR